MIVVFGLTQPFRNQNTRYGRGNRDIDTETVTDAEAQTQVSAVTMNATWVRLVRATPATMTLSGHGFLWRVRCVARSDFQISLCVVRPLCVF